MAATTTQPTRLLFKQIIGDFNTYTFVRGNDYVWSPEGAQITFVQPAGPADIWTLLHEIAHAELNHSHYNLDVELISREVDAWEHARKVLAPRYNLQIDPDHIEDHLDTYRLWLQQRSRCPECGQNGFQTTKNTYSCSNCRCVWRANEARVCRLRRTKLQS